MVLTKRARDCQRLQSKLVIGSQKETPLTKEEQDSLIHEPGRLSGNGKTEVNGKMGLGADELTQFNSVLDSGLTWKGQVLVF